MEIGQLFEILSIEDRLEQAYRLNCITKHQKSIFCKNFVSQISASTTINLNVKNNFINHCQYKLSKSIDSVSIIEGIKTVISWIKHRNIMFDEIINSAEAVWAYNIMSDEKSSDSDFQIAGELLKMTVLLIDTKVSTSEFFIQKIMELALLFEPELCFEKAKVLCQIFLALAENFFQRVKNQESSRQIEKIFKILCFCASNKALCELTFPFFKKLPGFLKSNRRYEVFIEEFIIKLCVHCRLIDSIEMETNSNVSLWVFRENTAEILKDLAMIIDLHKMLQFILQVMSKCSAEDLEVCLYVIACVAKKIDRAEEKFVPQIVETILVFDNTTQNAIVAMGIKVLGQLGHWISTFHYLYLADILNFLVKFLNTTSTLAAVAVTTLGQISIACNKKMEPYLSGLFEIHRNLKNLSLFSRPELAFIKGLTSSICCIESQNAWKLLKYLCELQFERIFEAQNKEEKADLHKALDQLAGIYDNAKMSNGDEIFASVFVEHWSIISALLDSHQSNSETTEKIVECLLRAIPNLGLSMLPILDQIVKQLMCLYAVRNYDCLLTLMNVIVDKLGSSEKCKNGFLITFEGFTMLTFNVLHDEKKLNFPVIEEYFILATTCILKLPVYMLTSFTIVSVMDLGIKLLKVGNKNANRAVLKFLAAIFTLSQAQSDIKLYVEQAMSVYCEPIVMSLLESLVFVLDVTLISNVVDIFCALRDKTVVGFYQIFAKALIMIPKRGLEGKVTVTEASIGNLLVLMKRQNLSKAEMITGLTDFRKLVRG